MLVHIDQDNIGDYFPVQSQSWVVQVLVPHEQGEQLEE